MTIDLKDKKILITGASGSLGQQLIFELNKMGIKPVAHIRDTSDTSYIDSHNLEKRYGDLRRQDDLDKLVESIDLVIHTAAWVNFRQDRLTQFTGINTFGAIGLYEAAKKAGVKRFLHVSTVAAVGAISRKQNGGNVDDELFAGENTRFNLDHLRIPYILTKRAAEKELFKAAEDSLTELVIVNPSIVVAPSRTGDDRTRAGRWFSRFIMPGFHVRLNLVDIRDVVPGIIAALEKGRPGERYILAGDNISVRDLVLTASAILERAPHVTRIPRPVLDFAARAAVIGSKLLGKGKVSFYPDLVRMLDYDWVYTSRKAREELGYTNRSVHTTLDELLTNNFVGTYMKPGNGDA